MTQIGFYHLTRTRMEDALPKLLDRCLQTGKRAVVLCADQAAVLSLDEALWACTVPAWLPHGTARDGDMDLQPIWITDQPEGAPEAAHVFLTDGRRDVALERYERAFDLFDGTDATEVAAARARWRAWGAEGHALTYWSQGARGWEKQGA